MGRSMSLQTKSPLGSHSSTARKDAYRMPLIPAVEHPTLEDGMWPRNIQRVIVLIPSADIDGDRLQQELIRLGLQRSHEIVLLGNDVRNHRIRLNHLQRLAIHLRAAGIQVTCQNIGSDESWSGAIQRVSQLGDLIACHAEYQGDQLGQKISSELGMAVCVLSGLYPTLAKRLVRLVGRACFEVTPLVIILVTFWFQIQISEQMTGLVNIIALIMSVLFELGLIFIWSLFVA